MQITGVDIKGTPDTLLAPDSLEGISTRFCLLLITPRLGPIALCPAECHATVGTSLKIFIIKEVS
jgi:hypothetical protein